MGIRQFFRAFRATKGQPRPASPEDHIADDIREAMGPDSGGGGGHATGEAVYHYVEDHEQQPHRRDDD